MWTTAKSLNTSLKMANSHSDELSILKDDARDYIEWAGETLDEGEPYDITYHICVLESAIRDLNEIITKKYKAHAESH